MTRYEVQPTDLEMRVRTLFDQGRTRLSYNFHSPTGAVAFAHREIAGPEFPGSSEDLQSRLLKKIERLGQLEDIDGTRLSTSERDRKLENIGHDLWRDLLPPEIRSAYREIRRSVRTWTIVSDEPWIPWELIKPYDASDPEEILDDEFLTLQFELTRWLAGDKTPALQISVERLAAIEASKELPSAITERESLVKIVEAHSGVIDVSPRAASATEILEFLRGEGADLLHFIGHGIQVTNQPEESGIQLQDGSILRAVDLSGAIATRIAKVRPFVFLNACWAGRQGRALTRLGGWAMRLVGICGCGAFVAPMWPVRDSTAAIFSEAFYRNLEEGAALGEAALSARRHAFQTSGGDPSALAYVTYGHPNAQVRFGPRVVPREAETSPRLPRLERKLSRSPVPRTPILWIAFAALAGVALFSAMEFGRRSVQEASTAVEPPGIRLTSSGSVPSEKPREGSIPTEPGSAPRPSVSKTSTSPPAAATASSGNNRFELEAAEGVPKSLSRALTKAAAPLVKAGIEGWTIHLVIETPQLVAHEQDGFPWMLCRLVANGEAKRQGVSLDLGSVIAVNSQVDSTSACEACTDTLAKSIVKRFLNSLPKGAP